MCFCRQRHRDRARCGPRAFGRTDCARRQLAADSDAIKRRQRAGQQLEALRQERGRGLQAKQKELEDVVRQLAKDTLPQADRERLSQDESRRRAELQQLTTQAQTEFQATQARLNTELRSQLTPILADIAKRAGVMLS